MPSNMNPRVEAVVPAPIADVRSWIGDASSPRAEPLLDVAQAVPGYPPPRVVVEQIAALAGRPEMSLYTDILGLPALRARLAQHLSEDYRAPIECERVAITPGCNQAFCVAAMALAGPGDEIILPVPYYFNHQMWLDMQGIAAVHLPLLEARDAEADLASMADLVSPRTRAIVLVTPNNPTGAEYPRAFVHGVYRLARRHGLALVLDETYKDFRSSSEPPHHLFQDADWPDTLVQLFSFSKSYSLAGYRVGSIVAGPALLSQAEKILDCLAICAPRLAQEAACLALEHASDWRTEKSALMARRRDRLRLAFQRNDLRYELTSSGAYFAYVRHPFADRPAAEVARRLAERHRVLCVPGSVFGPGQEAYLRLAYANLDEARIPSLVSRLAASQSRLV